MNDFPQVVSAIAYSVIRERYPDECQSQNRVARFVVEQHGRMSTHFRVPLLVLTIAFDLGSVVVSGSRFRCRAHASRWKYIDAWRKSRIGVCRDLIRFYESLVVFGCYSIEYPQVNPALRVAEVEGMQDRARVA